MFNSEIYLAEIDHDKLVRRTVKISRSLNDSLMTRVLFLRFTCNFVRLNTETSKVEVKCGEPLELVFRCGLHLPCVSFELIALIFLCTRTNLTYYRPSSSANRY